MPSKPKAPALDRLVRREWTRLQMAWGCPGDETCLCRERRAAFRLAFKRVAAECARIAREKARRIQEHGLTGAPAVESVAAKIEREFGIEEGEDG